MRTGYSQADVTEFARAMTGWTGQQATGMLWCGDQASDFWSLRVLLAATVSAAHSGISNWSHDVGGYLGDAGVKRASVPTVSLPGSVVRTRRVATSTTSIPDADVRTSVRPSGLSDASKASDA